MTAKPKDGSRVSSARRRTRANAFSRLRSLDMTPATRPQLNHARQKTLEWSARHDLATMRCPHAGYRRPRSYLKRSDQAKPLIMRPPVIPSAGMRGYGGHSQRCRPATPRQDTGPSGELTRKGGYGRGAIAKSVGCTGGAETVDANAPEAAKSDDAAGQIAGRGTPDPAAAAPR